MKIMQKRGLRSVKATDCLEFYSALNSLDENFFYLLEAGGLTENELIKSRR